MAIVTTNQGTQRGIAVRAKEKSPPGGGKEVEMDLRFGLGSISGSEIARRNDETN